MVVIQTARLNQKSERILVPIQVGDVSIDMEVDVTIDGVFFPKFSWGWIGLKVGEAILSGCGGLIFSKLLSAIVGGPSMEELLVRAISREMKRLLEENDLRNYTALLSSLSDLMTEYANNPNSLDRLTYAVNQSSDLVNLTNSLGYIGYPAFISAANLRIAVLQEKLKVDPADRPNFLAAREQYRNRHLELRRQFRQDWETEVATAKQKMTQEYDNYSDGIDNLIQTADHFHGSKISRDHYNYADRTFLDTTYDPKPNYAWNKLFDPMDSKFAQGEIITQKWLSFNP
jgi:hypothetical protein